MPVKSHQFVTAAAILAFVALSPVRASAQVNVPEPIGGMRGNGGGAPACAQPVIQAGETPWQSLAGLYRLMPRFSLPAWQPRVDIARPPSAIARRSTSR